jgi:2-phospho-L-lactate guanylyltransferase
VAAELDLIVPVKPPAAGKSRLRGAVTDPDDDRAHAELVLAMAADTLAAARAAVGVRRVLVVAGDPGALAELRTPGVEVVREGGAHGLNSALRFGEALLRADDPRARVAALQADLPALRAHELAAALVEASGRTVVTDRQGTGTTLLVSGPGQPLEPRFGAGSAFAHLESGASALRLPVPSLRADVDTRADLDRANELGLGERTRRVLAGHAGHTGHAVPAVSVSPCRCR